ncbi:MAG: hypothetical protein C0507_23410 [Cyanobacteria bacterium PR.3.49]|nr:hypothetical protein [Cyanobacteria bacterium PR.3.49]
MVVNVGLEKGLKLRWIDTLNEETGWTGDGDVLDWLYKLTGRRLNLSSGELATFFEQLGFMREQVTSLHFGESPALECLQERLQGISLTINEEHDLNGLPLLMARQASNSDADFLKSVCDTLLIQFAAFLSEALDSQSSPKIVRCEGLFREEQQERKRLGALPAQRESAWRAEISLIHEAEPRVADEIQRCEDLFVLSSKAKFCSDACRFATFQISKQLKEPGYMKEKQRRYRNRKEKH